MRSVHPKQPEGEAAAAPLMQASHAPRPAPRPQQVAEPEVSPLGFDLPAGSTESAGSGLPTAWCLNGGAHCSTPPNQKRPRKSNPAETTPPLQPPQWTNRGVGGNPLAASPIEKKKKKKNRKLLRDQSELQMTIQVGQYGEVRVSVAG